MPAPQQRLLKEDGELPIASFRKPGPSTSLSKPEKEEAAPPPPPPPPPINETPSAEHGAQGPADLALEANTIMLEKQLRREKRKLRFERALKVLEPLAAIGADISTAVSDFVSIFV
jgi:hypothetical protein